MTALSSWFEKLFFGDDRPHKDGSLAAIIGTGGKTSLIWHLAGCLARPGKTSADGQSRNLAARRKILVTPTAKMLVPEDISLYDRYIDFSTNGNIGTAARGTPVSGITLAGSFNRQTGKLEALPPQALEELIPFYDLVLAEADGSRGLPLKAWAANEPVVPHCASHTIGVLPLWPIGKTVSEELIHRLDLFLALTGASRGETINNGHILKLIAGNGEGPPTGIFAKARGKKVLFFSQIEDRQTFAYAQKLSLLLPARIRDGLEHIIAGSVKLDSLEELG